MGMRLDNLSQKKARVSSQHVALHYTDPQPQRLDKFLVEALPDFSRSRLQALIKEGQVTVNGEVAHKSGLTVEGPAEILVHIPAPQLSDLAPEEIPLDIVFENEDLVVINKPAGMVVHPAAGHSSGTLVHAALAHSPEIEGIGGVQRPGVVHRLDKDTSGLILVAKNDRAHRWLVEQFRSRHVSKVYITLVDGHPPTPVGRIETPIGRSTADRKMMAVVSPEHGREAVSEYRVLESFPAHTLVEVHPITGRTHQIRIHMKFIGCPVTGDTVYGHHKPTLPIRRQFLHAARITFTLPGENSPRTFEAPLPADLLQILEDLQGMRPPNL